MTTANKFLLSGSSNEYLATEKTLSDINVFLQSGALEVTTNVSNVMVDNFPSVQEVGISTSNQVGNLRVSEQDTNFSSAMDNLANNVLDVGIDVANQIGNLRVSEQDTNFSSAMDNLANNVLDVGIDVANQIGNFRVNEQNSNFSGAMNNLSIGNVQVQSNNQFVATETTVNSMDTRLASIQTNTGTIASNTTSIDGKQSTIVTNTGTIATNSSTLVTNTTGLALESGNLAFILNNTGTANTHLYNILITTTSMDGKLPTLGQKTSSGSVATVLSNDFASTTIQRPFTSSMYFEKMIITGNLSGTYGADTTITFGSWSGSTTNPIYLTYLELSIYTSTSTTLKMNGWGTVTTPMTAGFYIDYKRNSSDSAHPLMGTNSTPITRTLGVYRESDEFQYFNTNETTIKGTLYFKENPILIENASVGTRGTIRITFKAGAVSSIGNVDEMYLLAGYYYS